MFMLNLYLSLIAGLYLGVMILILGLSAIFGCSVFDRLAQLKKIRIVFKIDALHPK